MIAGLEPSATGLLLAAAFAAGALNAVAGGGTFLTMPALVAFAGMGPLAASATSTAALLPGYLSTALVLRKDAVPLPGLSPTGMVLACGAGGACGAALLLLTPKEAFAGLLPWLVLLASILFMAGPQLCRWLQARRAQGRGASACAVFLASLYGGYFNGGLGVVLLATLSIVGGQDLKSLNGQKSALSAVLTAIAVLMYAAGGAVAWVLATPLMLAACVGGWAGVQLLRCLPTPVLRGLVVFSGFASAAWFFAARPA
ncbi:MAG TPA: sulfite exporter TauE/SafE family protein [Ramlibacter sp.]|nr:sulfite exporter TauE/SafE family protein [Ramlibacter sp.]